MSTRNRFRRLMAMVLSAAMLLSLLPAGVMAAEGTTISGEETTTNVGINEVTGRNNGFNRGWKFFLGTSGNAHNKNFDDSAWDKVDLPHDFSISQDFTSSGEAESGFLPGGTGWYRKTFTLDEELAGQTILLNFDGVYSDATVYVNGEYVGEHHYGYTSFAFDITDLLVCDGATENVIAVETVNSIPTSRWYSGSGIYRDVTLIVTAPVHVDLNGTKVTTPTIADGQGDVDIAVEIVNNGDADAEVTLVNTIYAKGEDTPLAIGDTTVTVEAGSKAAASAGARVEEPKLWSIEAPNLYVVKTELSVDGQVVDTYETEFGFRWFSFDASGFHLNGENVKLNGVCMHHDQGALGSAAYYDAIYRQMSIMKDMGCNAIRVTHNPAAQYLIDICNELGLLVVEETFDGLVDAKNSNYNDFSKWFEITLGEDNGLYNGQADMMYSEYVTRSIIKRDRNAPSIIAWSFGNEIQEGTGWGNVSRYDDICANYITWANDVDGTRPVTSGDNNRGGNANLVNVINTITASGGIAGFNYANSASTLYSLATSYGGDKGVIIASETASATNSRGRYMAQSSNSSIDGSYHLTSYDTSAVPWGITAHDSIYNTYQYDCVAGEFVWTGFDYIGEPTPWNGTSSGDNGRGAIPNSSYFGIVETTGFAKDTYYLYRSQWNKDETTLNLVTAWDDANMMVSGDKTPVWIYSNAPVVKLYRNGEHIGTATRSTVTSQAGHTYYTYATESLNTDVCIAVATSGADQLYSIFNVAYEAGTISAKAFQADGTTEIALDENSGNHTVSTPGAVSKLVISQDKTQIDADGKSLVYITVDVTDENGTIDTMAANNITFTLEGEGVIMGVDNGDQATTKKYQQTSVLTSDTTANINAYAGKALVIVKSTDEAGTITLDIASEGLTGGQVTVNTASVGQTQENSIVSYTLVKDYSVMTGTKPVLATAVTATLADGSTVTGTVEWEEVTAEVYGTAGDHNIRGTATFEGFDPIMVSTRLHVIADVVAMLNISKATTAGVVPELPKTVQGVLADGTVTGEFAVNWETVDPAVLANVGDVAVVNGTATVLGEDTLPVTCTLRVAQAIQGESVNMAPMADSLTQDVPSGYQSDRLESIINDILKPGDNTSERWTNWNNRTRSDNATLTLTWATAQMVSSVNLFYYYDNCCAYPKEIEFSYSLNGQDYQVIGHTAELVETYSNGAQHSYTFDEPINPVGLKIKLTQQSGTSGSNCVGLTEVQVMSYLAEMEVYSQADLSGITVGGTAVENFSPEVLLYQLVGAEEVSATTDVNAAITILPAYESMVRILVVSEDGNEMKTYILSSDEDAILATSKAAAVKELTAYADALDPVDYSAEAQGELAEAEEAGKKAINAAESVEAVAEALANAKAAIDAVGTIAVMDDLSASDLDVSKPATVTFVEGENEGSRAVQGSYSIEDTTVLNAAMTAGKPFTVSSRVYVPADALSTSTGSWDGSDKHNMIVALGDNTFALRVTTNKSGSVNVQTFVHGSGGWYQIGKPVGADFGNKWHDIAATYEGTTLSLYVDGVLFDQRTDATASITDEGIPFSVGCDPTKPLRLSELTVDQIAVFNECLTAEELAADHLPGDENVIFWSDYEEVTDITLDQTEAQIDLGETLELTASLQPAGIARALTWSSSDEAVATVENGVVTAAAAGEAVITVSAEGGVSASCAVTVIDPVAIAKEAALAELADYRAAKADIGYKADKIEQLNTAAAEGKAAIEAAQTVEAVAQALEDAKAAIDAVEAILVLDDLSASDLDTDLPETAQFVEGEAEGSRAVKGYYSVADADLVINQEITGGKPFTVTTKFYVPESVLDTTTGSFEWGDKFNIIFALGDNTLVSRVCTNKSGLKQIQTFAYDGGWRQTNYGIDDSFAGKWHDIAVTYADGVLTVFVDGVQAGTANSSTVIDSGYKFSVGWDPSKDRFSDLIFDEVVVYNEALSLEALAEKHHPSDENVILWMDYEDEAPALENEDLNESLAKAVAAAKAAAEAAKAAQAAAEEAAGSTAEDQSAAQAAADAAEAAQEVAETAAKAAETAKQAAQDFAEGAGNEAVKAAAEAAKAAEAAQTAAEALATAASAAQKAQAAQAAAEKAEADAVDAAEAAEKAAQSAAEDQTAAEAAASAAKVAEKAAEAAKTAAEKAKDAAEKSLDAAAESNKSAAAQASAAAAAAQASAVSASSAAGAAKNAAQAAANAQQAQQKAEEAAGDTAIEKEEAEKALADALKAKQEAEATAAATGLALEKFSATLDLEDLVEQRLNGANADQAEDLAAVAEAAAAAIATAESAEAVAQALAAAEAQMDEILKSLCAAEEFTDVDINEWYHEAIDFVLNNGMMNGNGNGTFTPDASLNRAMLVQILYNIQGRPVVESDKSFTDVAEDDWWYNAVVWAAENGIVLGNTDGTYAPEDAVTREQMVTILYRYAGSPEVESDELTFDDAADVDDWAVKAVAWAVENGVVKGVGNNRFNPDGDSTRAETAQVMYNYFK